MLNFLFKSEMFEVDWVGKCLDVMKMFPIIGKNNKVLSATIGSFSAFAVPVFGSTVVIWHLRKRTSAS